MSGFQFAPKREIEICGRRYECDIVNNDLIEGVERDFPQVMRLANELVGLMDEGAELVGKNGELLEKCRQFLFGALGESEYQEIFTGRRPNSLEHFRLCAYVYGFIVAGRGEYVNQYLDPPKEESYASGDAAARDSGDAH